MIKLFVERFMERKEKLYDRFSKKHPDSYEEIVRAVIEILDGKDHDVPDPERIHVIDDGDYQGTLVFVIGAKGYQPDDYWYVKVGYGSCSGCDTFEGIKESSKKPPTMEQTKDYLMLALHIIQGLTKMGDEPELEDVD